MNGATLAWAALAGIFGAVIGGVIVGDWLLGQLAKSTIIVGAARVLA